MEMRFKYAIDMVLWRVGKAGRAESFKVNVIIYDSGAVYYGNERYNVTEERLCFPSKEMLLAYVAGEDNTSTDEGEEA